jgi:hypothetical protein
MKAMTIAALLAAPFLLPAPASTLSAAASRGGPAGITAPVTVPSHSLRRHDAIMALREEGLKLQTSDGGQLTEAHRAYLQAKYDAIRTGNY